MKLKKYKVMANPYGHVFSDGAALGKERYGFKNGNCIILIEKIKDTLGDDHNYYIFNSSNCIEVQDNEEMPASTAHSFSSGSSSLLTALGDKPSKITIEF